MKIILTLSILISLQIYALAQVRYYPVFRSRLWGYEQDGTTRWFNMNRECNGNRQSPIDIRTRATVSSRDAIRFSNYNVPTGGVTLENTGNNALLTVESNKRPIISSKQFGENIEYILEEVHFHWGKTSADGSDHRVDGNPFPLEAHFVHHNKAYANIDEALGKRNGVTVIGVLFSITKNANPNLNPIVNNLKKITNANQTTSIPNINFNELLPRGRSSYYYSGSLTTPPCTENVNWAVLEDTVRISENQIKSFRTLKNNNGKPLVGNFRPTQKLNGRIVKDYSDKSSSYK